MRKLLITCYLLLPFIICGSGFQLRTQGIKMMGLGGFSPSVNLDASTVFYNPGAISFLSMNCFTAGASVVFPRISYLDPYVGNNDMDVSLSVPFHLYGIYKLKHNFTAGLSINNPFGLNTKWEKDWPGRYITIENRLKTMFIQPTIAYQFNEHFSIGGGPVIGWAGRKEVKAIDIQGANTDYGIAEYKNNGVGFGFNAGAYILVNAFSAGITYRSQLKIELNSSKATFTDIPEGGAMIYNIPSSAEFNTDMRTPAVIEAGVAYKFDTKFQVTANISFSQWSVLDSVKMVFVENPDLDFSKSLNYKDAFAINAGVQYQYNERTWFRAGATYDQNHVPDGYLNPAEPDADKYIFAGGASYIWKPGLTLDAAIMYKNHKSRVETGNRQFNFNGEYKTSLYILGIGLNYEF